jgi:hypothetical protein
LNGQSMEWERVYVNCSFEASDYDWSRYIWRIVLSSKSLKMNIHQRMFEALEDLDTWIWSNHQDCKIGLPNFRSISGHVQNAETAWVLLR